MLHTVSPSFLRRIECRLLVKAATHMKVGDYFVQDRKRSVPFHEKSGNQYEMPAHTPSPRKLIDA